MSNYVALCCVLGWSSWPGRLLRRRGRRVVAVLELTRAGAAGRPLVELQ
jgi:hypothetical protein